MSAIRPLSRVPERIPGEAFSSYVDRLAAMHQVDLLVMLHALGIISGERYETINGYGVIMSEAQLEGFCIATKMPKEHAKAMLMSNYDGVSLNFSEVTPDKAYSLTKRAREEWGYFAATNVCPQCVLQDDGAWQLAWKLPWTFACVRHKCYLESYCPGCERKFRSGRRDSRLSPVFVRHVPKLGMCNNPLPLGESAGKGNAAVPCGYPLADIPVQPAGQYVLSAQKQVNDALAGGLQSICGVLVLPRDFFGDLRSVCALLLYCAEAGDLDRLSNVELAAVTEFAIKRNDILTKRRESDTPKNAERMRAFIGPPDDAKLMAAVVRHALSILGATDHEAMADAIKPIAERLIARTAKARWEVMKYFRFSERIAPAFHLALAQKSTFNRAVGNRSLLAKEARYAFEPSHVPQLLWAAAFESEFSNFFPEVGSNYARRFCSMSLVKLCGDYTWGDTARLLGLPEHPGIKLANRCVGFLGDENTKRQFSRSLHAIATRLSEDNAKVNYEHRRKTFSGLTDIPRDDWLRICKQAQITPGHPGRRSRYAAVWLWSYLTSGDWTLAPALEGENVVNAREVYRTMLQGVLVDCRRALINYGATLLAQTPY